MNADGLFHPGDDRRYSLERLEFMAEMQKVFPGGQGDGDNLVGSDRRYSTST